MSAVILEQVNIVFGFLLLVSNPDPPSTLREGLGTRLGFYSLIEQVNIVLGFYGRKKNFPLAVRVLASQTGWVRLLSKTKSSTVVINNKINTVCGGGRVY